MFPNALPATQLTHLRPDFPEEMGAQAELVKRLGPGSNGTPSDAAMRVLPPNLRTADYEMIRHWARLPSRLAYSEMIYKGKVGRWVLVQVTRQFGVSVPIGPLWDELVISIRADLGRPAGMLPFQVDEQAYSPGTNLWAKSAVIHDRETGQISIVDVKEAHPFLRFGVDWEPPSKLLP